MRQLTTVTDELLGPLLADPHRPALVVYTAAGRTELSVATLANWAAKVAGLLVDELGCRPGDQVLVRLPAGWQTAGVLLGCWWAGCVVTDQDGAAGVAAFVAPGDDAAADEVFVVSGHPLGAPAADLAAHQRDFGSAVLIHADRFSPPAVNGSDPAVATEEGLLSVDDLLAAARAAAPEPAARVLSTADWELPDGVLELLGPLAAAGSLVQLAGPGTPDVEHVRSVERVW